MRPLWGLNGFSVVYAGFPLAGFDHEQCFYKGDSVWIGSFFLPGTIRAGSGQGGPSGIRTIWLCPGTGIPARRKDAIGQGPFWVMVWVMRHGKKVKLVSEPFLAAPSMVK